MSAINRRAVAASRALAGAMLSLAAVSPSIAHAQQADTVGVLVHGLNASGATWGQFLADIGALYREPLLTPTLAQLPYPTQAASLLAPLSGLTVRGLVGHSNGGVVSREGIRQGLTADALITIGTPHQGTPFADNRAEVSAGMVGNLIGLLGPLAEVALLPSGLVPEMDWAIGQTNLAAAYLYAFDFLSLGIASLFGFDDSPLVESMGVAGYAASTLNTAGNLLVESQRVGTSIGVRTIFDADLNAAYVWLKVASPDNWESWAIYWETARALYYGIGITLFNIEPFVPEAVLVGASLLQSIPRFDLPDYIWCDGLGAPAWTDGNFFACTQTDGLVPLWSQTHPLQTLPQTPAFDVAGVPHTAQLRNLFAEAAIVRAMDAGGFTRAQPQ